MNIHESLFICYKGRTIAVVTDVPKCAKPDAYLRDWLCHHDIPRREHHNYLAEHCPTVETSADILIGKPGRP